MNEWGVKRLPKVVLPAPGKAVERPGDYWVPMTMRALKARMKKLELIDDPRNYMRESCI